MSVSRHYQVEGGLVELFVGAALSAFRQRPELRTWAESLGVMVPSEANRMLAGKPYNFGLFPCISSLIFGFFERRDASELILMKDTQAAASTTAFWSCAWLLAHEPGNIIFITKGRDAAGNVGKDRMDHIFAGVPQLKRQRNDGIPNSTAMAKRFPGGTLFLGGCDTATTLIGQPASVVVLDEIKEHPFIDGKSTMDLARKRIKMDDEGKVLAFSTAGDAVEFVEDPKTGKKKPVPTPSSTPHLEYLSGTMEECQVPCPHCGFYQALEFERLQFGHCKESLPNLPAVWNRKRVIEETWYKCANPDCTDRNEDGTVRGKINEEDKPEMMRAHRWVATNPNPYPGRRSATISVLYNIAVSTSSWGHIANHFLDAMEKGTAEALKAFHTDDLGRPWAPHRVTSAALAKVIQLKRGYRAAEVDGRPRYRIPFTTGETAFVGGLIDVQADHLKWLIHAAAVDGRSAVLHWGMCQFLEDIPGIMTGRWYTCRGEEDETVGFPVTIVFMDVNGTRRADLYRALYQWRVSHPEIAWEGIAGRDKGQTHQVKIASWQIVNYPVLDEYRRPMSDAAGCPLTIRVHNIDADYWESRLYGEVIDRFDPKVLAAELVEKGSTPAEAEKLVRQKQGLWIPGDAPDSFLRELCNMHQVLRPTGRSGHMEYRWVKKTQGPNDYGDLCKYGQVQIHAVREENR